MSRWADRAERRLEQIRDERARGQRSGSAGLDNAGQTSALRALRTTLSHLEVLARCLEPMLEASEDTAAMFELDAMAAATLAALETTRRAVIESELDHGRAERELCGRRRDVGVSVARVAVCSAEVLRAHARALDPPTGTPIDDVPRALLWLIADLSVALRAAGRIGPTADAHDAGVAARDAADRVVTTYRRWRPRLVACDDATAVASLTVTAAYAAVWAGLSTVVPDDDDGAGVAAPLVSAPPSLSGRAEVALPESPTDPMPAVAGVATVIPGQPPSTH